MKQIAKTCLLFSKVATVISLLFIILGTGCSLLYSSDQSYVLPIETYLNIPDREQSPEAPPEGWCGEACIQMVALYYGQFLEQSYINSIADPIHPDLYSNDIPVALRRLNYEIEEWPVGGGGSIEDFFEWAKKNISMGYPIIFGAKIYPTNHPEWFFDHFMVLKGYNAESFQYNTTWGYDETKSYSSLSSLVESGFAIENIFGLYYGIAIKGSTDGS